MACEVQEVRDSARCFCGVSVRELLGQLVYLNCQQLTLLDPMAECSPQAVRDASRCFCGISELELLGMLVYLQCQILDSGGGGGGGAVAAEGENFCFSGTAPNQIFKIKNLDTAGANRIDTEGADPEQTIVIEGSSAC